MQTHPDSHLTCVDTFGGSYEHRGTAQLMTLEQMFDAVTSRFGSKLTKIVGPSGEVLRRYPRFVCHHRFKLPSR